jgi:hypothetical protein
MKDEQMSINLNLDTTPILYTDNIIVSTNDDGVVLEFCQRFGPENQIRIVSRMGMSRDHAKKFLATFGKQLALREAQSQTTEHPN